MSGNLVNSSKLVPPNAKLTFMDMPKPSLPFVDSEKLPPVPGAVRSENVPLSSAQDGGRSRRKSVLKGKKVASRKSSSRKGAKGGALIDDVKNLAVPFAILLAKQGLQTMFDKKKNTSANSQLSAKVAGQPTSSRRRSTIAGGSCGSACASAAALPSPPTVGGKSKKRSGGGLTLEQITPKAGGAPKPSAVPLHGGALPKVPGKLSAGGSKSASVKSRFEKLSKEIDAFLQKY